MNILVSNISTFSYQKIERKYRVCVPRCCVKELSAYHTNESILKCVVELENVKQTGGLNRIIALVSNKALTAVDEKYGNLTSVEYYSNQARELCSNVEIVLVNIEDDNNHGRDISAILSDICKNIQTYDVVYIDSAGGLRTISNVVQILTKILKYKGIENPCTLYSDIQNEGFITDTSSFNKITDLADAFNEFMTTGKADQLQQCFSSVENKEPYSSLVQSMVDFSDHIRLGNVERLDSVIKKLSGDIQNCMEDTSTDSMEGVIVHQFLPVIEDKLIGNQKEGVDYVRIIDWCIDNMLIQQALTLFVEKIPIYLFDKKIVSYKGSREKAKNDYKNNAKPGINAAEWETNVFYTDILKAKEEKQGKCAAASHPDVQNFKELLETKDESKASFEVKEAYRVLFTFKRNFPKSDDTSLLADRIRKHIDKHKDTAKEFWQFYRSIKNEPTTLADILGLSFAKKESSDKTLANKFEAIEKMKNQGSANDDFCFKVTIDRIVSIYYAYIYAKALRNRINHASSEENLIDEQKSILEAEGYDFSAENLKIIAKNLRLAVNSIKVAEESLQTKSIPPKPVKIEYHTDLAVGDIVQACVVGAKLVTIADYGYNVQLIIPKLYTRPLSVGQIVTVEIKQISKMGQIMQVCLKI